MDCGGLGGSGEREARVKRWWMKTSVVRHNATAAMLWGCNRTSAACSAGILVCREAFYPRMMMRKKIRVLSQPYVLRTGVTSVILEARRRLEWTSYALQGGLWWVEEGTKTSSGKGQSRG
jgi:hypothetical protein